MHYRHELVFSGDFQGQEGVRIMHQCTLCNPKYGNINLSLIKIKLLTGICQNWVLLSIHENVFELFDQMAFFLHIWWDLVEFWVFCASSVVFFGVRWGSVVKRRTRLVRVIVKSQWLSWVVAKSQWIS